MPTFGAACRVETRTPGGNPVFIAAAIERGRTTTLRPPAAPTRRSESRRKPPRSFANEFGMSPAAERFLNITPRDDDNPDPYAAG